MQKQLWELQEKRGVFIRYPELFPALNMDLREAIKLLINQRLTVIAEDIFSAVERVISDYEKEDAFLKQRIEDQRRILELVLKADTGWY